MFAGGARGDESIIDWDLFARAGRALERAFAKLRLTRRTHTKAGDATGRPGGKAMVAHQVHAWRRLPAAPGFICIRAGNLARALAACALACVLSLAEAAVPLPDMPSIDKLMTVDCLLPGQVRQLGTQMSYITARRAIKTSAANCEVRGGEYVAYDRSNVASALRVWLPAAQGGDKVAQTYVGEIYEKGLGTAPDYAAAAQWYRKAAEQGYSRAQINLGFLYERGLGVPKDPRQALEWYRRSVGLEGAIALDDGTTARARDAEIDALRRELEATRRELEKARSELEEQRKRLQNDVDALRRAQQAAASKGDAAEAKRVEALLKARDDELRRRQDQVDRLERASGDFRVQIAALEREGATLKGEVQSLRTALDKANAELFDRRKQAQADVERVAALRKELAGHYNKTTQSQTIDRAQIARLEEEIKRRETELTRRQAEIERLDRETTASRGELAKLEAAQTAAQAAAKSKEALVYAAPSIQLIDPPIVLTRNTAIPVRGDVPARDLVGRVTAPAGLFALTVNDQPIAADDQGLFRTRVALSHGSTPVTIVAIDRTGKRAQLDFALLMDVPPTAPARPTRAIIGSDFGKYYALVIGNENYQKLPRLDTAIADTTAIADVLKKRYSFEVTQLKNATRYQMMTAINQMTEKLTEKDNLLIYYAGHGELDRANLRAYWLPVDAEPNSDANWVSSALITDHLNRMTANHVLVIADSCYSGAMTRSSIGAMESGLSDEARINLLKSLAKARSRTALTSGGVQPVIDGGGGEHSVFAKNFLRILDDNHDVLEARRLYLELSARVVSDALKYKYEQKPEYNPIQYTGHEGGDFLFVPVN
jgi:Caspase domain/Sel1 repeat